MERIPLFPLRTILFPHTDLGIHVFEERYRCMVARCLDEGIGFGVVLIRRGMEVGGPAEPHSVGTLASITAHARLADGRYLLEVEGTRRFRIESMDGSASYPQATVSYLPEPIGDFGAARELSHEAENILRRYRARNGEGATHTELPVNPVARSYVLGSVLRIDLVEKQTLLDTESADGRLAQEVAIMRRELALLDRIRVRG